MTRDRQINRRRGNGNGQFGDRKDRETVRQKFSETIREKDKYRDRRGDLSLVRPPL